MNRNIFVSLTVAFVAMLCVATACRFSKPAAHDDAGTHDAGTQACVFDTDSFDTSCTFAP